MNWPFVTYPTQDEYRVHFEQMYCSGPLPTFDGIMVRFRKQDFAHCFFESSQRNGVKDTFSNVRAQRIGWIKETLADATAKLLAGWDANRRCYDHNRRVALVAGDYVVVIAFTEAKAARFITAYLMDTPSSRQKLAAAPKWIPPP